MTFKKIVIAMDIPSEGFGGGGGPHKSTISIMDSDLKNKYKFEKIIYRKELGKGISIKRIRDIINQIKKIKPDIVHFTGLQLSGFHMAIACKFAGINRTIVTIHGSSGDALDISKFKRFILKYFLETITLVLSKRVIGVSNYVTSKKIFNFFAPKKLYTIYNLPPNSYLNKNNNVSFRENLKFNKNDLLFVTVGRITKDKGYHILDEAILRLKSIANVKYIIVGDGDYLSVMKEKLKDMIDNNQVFLLGYQSNIPQILDSCDVFVLPTLHETLSIALLEASQASLALIASNTGGVPEIIKNKYNGVLVEPGNVKELSEAILNLTINKSLVKLYGSNAKLKIKEKFSSKEIVSKLDCVYESLLK